MTDKFKMALLADVSCCNDLFYNFKYGYNPDLLLGNGAVTIQVYKGCTPFDWACTGSDYSFTDAQTEGKTNTLNAVASPSTDLAVITVTDACGVSVTAFVNSLTLNLKSQGQKDAFRVATPVITAGGENDREISITCATGGAAIYYSEDNTNPSPFSQKSTLYSGAFTAPNTATVIKAAGFKVALIDSYIAEQQLANNTSSVGSNVFETLGIGKRHDEVNEIHVAQIVKPNGLYFTQISTGSQHTLAIDIIGYLWVWGGGHYGKLGFDNWDSKILATRLGSDTWSMVAAGGSHSLGIRSDGTLWGWGRNNYGQLGQGNELSNYEVPTQIGTIDDWEFISAGSVSSFAIRGGIVANGRMFATGYNLVGNLGLGDEDNRNELEQVPGMDHWTFVSAGGGHTVALNSQSKVMVTGSDNEGQLGLGYNESQESFTESDITGCKYVTTALYSSLAIKSNGSMWGCGYKYYGNLGDGVLYGSHTHDWVASGVDTDWTKVEASPSSAYSVYALKSNGYVYSFGRNQYGQLGHNNTDNYADPTLIQSEYDLGRKAASLGAGYRFGVFA